MRAGPLIARVVSPLQFLLLLQLQNEPKYGYEMLKFLRDEFEGVWDIRTGSFYPSLRSLEARGFVETDLKEDTEFYSLTPKGEALINGFGERLEIGIRFTNRYLKAMVKLMPPDLRTRALEVFRKLSDEDIDIYSAQMQLFQKSIDTDKMLGFLDELRGILEGRISMIERIRRDIWEGIESEGY
ncbi:MAG: helix-turn-helix transcriptional regulator [Candidatus Bathyarchaeota archaeon]